MFNRKMYTSANQYPEFQGKNKQFINGCLKYVQKKEKFGKRFWVVIIIIILGVIAWSLWIDDLFPKEWKEMSGIICAISGGSIFWVYLLHEINTRWYEAVKKHIGEYEHTK
ncbi:MAG: hypothetical protein GY931_09380 [Maribacter sp.]|nr:hypothetical protein [Maribacter sp.]